MKVVNSITELIGETPILRINRLTKPEDATVYVKLEGSNIGGSVKDRVGKYLLNTLTQQGNSTEINASLRPHLGIRE